MYLELIHTRSFSNQLVWNNFKYIDNSIQVPRGRFLINKCENNSKYIDYKHPGPKRSFSNQQVWINSRHIDPMYLELIHTRLFSIQQVWKQL